MPSEFSDLLARPHNGGDRHFGPPGGRRSRSRTPPREHMGARPYHAPGGFSNTRRHHDSDRLDRRPMHPPVEYPGNGGFHPYPGSHFADGARGHSPPRMRDSGPSHRGHYGGPPPKDRDRDGGHRFPPMRGGFDRGGYGYRDDKMPPRDPRDVHCFSCKQKGHKSNNCPSNMGGPRGGPTERYG